MVEHPGSIFDTIFMARRQSLLHFTKIIEYNLFHGLDETNSIYLPIENSAQSSNDNGHSASSITVTAQLVYVRHGHS
jgi:hypothetical protein